MTEIKIIGEDVPNLPWHDRIEKNDGFPIWRYENNPIIGWNPTPNTARAFNSAVIPYKGEFLGVFRADSRCINPHLHIGHSKDGFNWELDDNPIVFKDEAGNEFPEGNFAYDPRLVKIDEKYYIIWCCDFEGSYALGIATTTDFKSFTRIKNPLLPFNRNGVLFPRKINDKYILLSRPSDSGHTPFGDIYLSESADMLNWGNHRLVMKSGINWWQSTKIGAGPVPIETDKGWLLFYHGVITNCNGFVYSMGVALLDKDDPAKVLLRAEKYILTPEKSYETSGFVPNVVFPCAAMSDARTGRITVYYGAADTYIAVAFTTVQELYDYMINNNKLK